MLKLIYSNKERRLDRAFLSAVFPTFHPAQAKPVNHLQNAHLKIGSSIPLMDIKKMAEDVKNYKPDSRLLVFDYDQIRGDVEAVYREITGKDMPAYDIEIMRYEDLAKKKLYINNERGVEEQYSDITPSSFMFKQVYGIYGDGTADER